MNMAVLRNISFAAFIKLSVMISLITGLAGAVIFLVFNLLGMANINVDAGDGKISGLIGTVLPLIAIPLLAGLMGLIAGLIAYHPFLWWINFTNKSTGENGSNLTT